MSDHVERTRGAFLAKPTWWDVDGSHVINEAVPAADFLRLAKMGYNIEKSPAFDMVNGVAVPVPNQFHVRRSDDNRIVSPSTVTGQYVTRQPSDMVAIVDDIVQSGLGVYDAGFTLYGGQSEVVTVLLCDIEERVHCDGSKWQTYLVIQNYHGTGKMRGKIVRLRVVCHNTVTAGFAGGADWAFAHKQSIVAKSAGVPAMWKQAAAAVKQHCELLCKLDRKVVVPDTIDALLAIDDDATTQQKNRRDAILAAANDPSNGTFGSTLYDIFNAVTNYTTHHAGGKAGKSAAGRIGSILDGTRGDFEADMTSKLFQLAGVTI